MFKILKNNTSSSFTIKKSKFLTFGFFIKDKDEVKNILNDMKKQYPDASHICYAYVLDDNTYYYTDNGEPSGTAGISIYNAIKSFNLNYCLFIVVRYFGGIKFGPGPLKKTFKEVTIDTLNVANMKDAHLGDIIEIEVPLSISKKIISNLMINIVDKRYTSESVVLTLAGSKEELVYKLEKLDVKILNIKEKQVI